MSEQKTSNTAPCSESNYRVYSRHSERYGEQAISAARFIVRALLTVCAATVFLLLSNKANVYEESVDELNAFLSIDPRGLPTQIAKQNPLAGRQLTTLRNVLSGAGLKLSEPHTNLASLAIAESGYSFWNLSGGASLESLDGSFSGMRVWKADVFNVESVKDAVRQFLRDNKTRIHDFTSEVSVTFGVQASGLEVTLGGQARDGERQQVSGVIGALGPQIQFSMRINVPEAMSHVPETRDLVGKRGDGFYLLPKTKRIWNEVRGLSASDARDMLARKAGGRDNSLEVFGLSIPERTVSWVTPSLVFGLSVYLFLYLRRMSNLLRRDRKLRRYPWVHVMPGFLASAVTVFVVILLPCLVLVWTALSTAGSSSAFLLAYSSVTSIVGGIFLIADGRSLLRIQRAPNRIRPRRPRRNTGESTE